MAAKLPHMQMTECGGMLSPFQGVWPRLEGCVYILPGAHIIGDVIIGHETSVWHNCVVRGDVHHIRIGKRTNIQDGTIVHVTTGKHPTVIGDDVLVAHSVTLHGCVLEDRAFVGMASIVMDGAVIESDGMLAAGSLLPPGKTVNSGELWRGWPAQHVRNLSNDEIVTNRAMAEHYCKIAEQHRCDLKDQVNPEPYPPLKARDKG